MAAVSVRYAEALLDSVDDKTKALESLECLSALYSANTEFKETINNPRITNAVKLDIMKEIIYNDNVFINFIALVLKEGRFNLISDICDKYREKLNKINKVINVTIITTFELSEKEINDIISKYKKLYQANEVKYEIKTDKTLIGGIKVVCEGKVYDDTIKTKLSEML